LAKHATVVGLYLKKKMSRGSPMAIDLIKIWNGCTGTRQCRGRVNIELSLNLYVDSVGEQCRPRGRVNREL
jgi:hypothetical protein